MRNVEWSCIAYKCRYGMYAEGILIFISSLGQEMPVEVKVKVLWCDIYVHAIYLVYKSRMLYLSILHMIGWERKRDLFMSGSHYSKMDNPTRNCTSKRYIVSSLEQCHDLSVTRWTYFTVKNNVLFTSHIILWETTKVFLKRKENCHIWAMYVFACV